MILALLFYLVSKLELPIVKREVCKSVSCKGVVCELYFVQYHSNIDIKMFLS